MPPSRTAIAAHFGLANFPVAYCGLKIITSLSLRFPDFQRVKELLKTCYIS
ncbi:Serine/threonine protein kinase [methanotrophic endosymbiont of Bathymodiolus azoricus (Menez Gwen)]|nr:Serine/threonine protein kinase [methanotrophic endosymbiont of Bathymodiolus azoricus (Menez Gwen)]